jgi:hypothetical protein
MAGTKVITNATQLRRALKQVPDGLKDLTTLNLEVATIALSASRPPVVSGQLAGSQSAHATRTKARIWVRAPYAAPIHWGWPHHNIRPNPWLSTGTQQSEPQWTEHFATGITTLVDKAQESCQS